MAVTGKPNGLLALMPPSADAPHEPTTYGSPAKMTSKRECLKVDRVPSIDRLIQQQALDLEAAAAEDEANKGEEEDDGDDAAAANVHTYKKSQYWTKEIEEKLGLAGADPYGLLELEERRHRATPDEIRKAYRRLVLTHHPDKKQSEEAVKAMAKKEKKEKEVNEDKENEDGEEEAGEEDEDSEFKLLGAAYELLSNVETRRQYDSIDNFNDFLPTNFHPKKGAPRCARACACMHACVCCPTLTSPRSLLRCACDRPLVVRGLRPAVCAPVQILVDNAGAAGG